VSNIINFGISGSEFGVSFAGNCVLILAAFPALYFPMYRNGQIIKSVVPHFEDPVYTVQQQTAIAKFNLHFQVEILFQVFAALLASRAVQVDLFSQKSSRYSMSFYEMTVQLTFENHSRAAEQSRQMAQAHVPAGPSQSNPNHALRPGAAHVRAPTPSRQP